MIRGKQFVDVRFEQQDVEGEQFSECRFIGCNFSWLDLGDSRFIDCSFYDRESERGCLLQGCDLREASFLPVQSPSEIQLLQELEQLGVFPAETYSI